MICAATFTGGVHGGAKFLLGKITPDFYYSIRFLGERELVSNATSSESKDGYV